MRYVEGIPVWGDPIEEQALVQIKRCAPTAVKAALMADHHQGYAVPIGGVIAYQEHISPSGVGFDIACGNKAVRLDMPAVELKRKINKIMDDIFHKLSFGVGLNNNEKVDHELFEDDAWKIYPCKAHRQMAQNQLGTIGSGNHYVDLFVDEEDRVWIGVHFGSRGLGHKIASHFIEAGGGKEGIHVDPVLLHERSDLGEQYLKCMQLAGRYAYAGRDWVCGKVARILKAHIVEEVHNNHNYAWHEEHDGMPMWVVRKGATPAFPGQKGFVGGSMGDISVILEGVDSEDAKASLYSAMHGAGRVMSRTQAAGKPKKGKRTGGCISREMMDKWVRDQGVTLRGAGTDESPHCYKRLPEVLEHHKSNVKVLHTLKPVGVAMAGEDVYDPFKD